MGAAAAAATSAAQGGGSSTRPASAIGREVPAPSCQHGEDGGEGLRVGCNAVGQHATEQQPLGFAEKVGLAIGGDSGVVCLEVRLDPCSAQPREECQGLGRVTELLRAPLHCAVTTHEHDEQRSCCVGYAASKRRTLLALRSRQRAGRPATAATGQHVSKGRLTTIHSPPAATRLFKRARCSCPPAMRRIRGGVRRIRAHRTGIHCFKITAGQPCC